MFINGHESKKKSCLQKHQCDFIITTLQSRTRFRIMGETRHVYGRLYLSFQLPIQIAASSNPTDQICVIEIKMPEHCEMDDASISPSNLEDVYLLCRLIKQKILSSSTAKIVVCAGPIHRMHVKAAFLLGCYLLLSTDLSVEETWRHFDQLGQNAITTFSCCDGLGLIDFWGAIHRARLQNYRASLRRKLP